MTEIETEQQITPEWAVALREELKMTQKDFWSPALVKKSQRSRYESSEVPIPDQVKRLMFLHYVKGNKLGQKVLTTSKRKAK